MAYLIFSVSGFLVGVTASLLGIGGGIILVPLFWYLFPKVGVPDGVCVKASIATSLSLIACMSFISSGVHVRRGGIGYGTVMRIGVASVVGVAVASLIVSRIEPEILKKVFSVFLMVMSFRMFTERHAERRWNVKAAYPLTGFLSGLASGMLGIGGGVVVGPLLFTFTDLEPFRVVAVGSAVTFINAFSGTVSYIMLNRVGEPGFLGPIFLPAFISTLPLALIGSRIGAKLSYRVERRLLKRLFSILLAAVALKLLI